MTINLKALSELLGLSQTTVSRALGGYNDVSPATRERVEKMAKELGYQPSRAARQTARGRADAVGMVYPLGADYLGNPSVMETLSGLSNRLEQANIDLLLAAAHPSSEMRTYERIVRGRWVDALIVAQTRVFDARIDYLLKSGMPFLAYGRTGHPEGYPWFDFDNEAGSRLAVEKLVDIGHQRIGYVHQPLHFNFARHRHAGFIASMQRASLPIQSDGVIGGCNGRRDGYAAGQRLLALPQRPTAVIVDGNLNGLGLIRAFYDGDIEIGRDISLIVNEGVPEDLLLRGLQVASIQQPTSYTSGQALGEMVLALVERRPLAEPHVLLQPVFVDGNSIGPPPAE